MLLDTGKRFSLILVCALIALNAFVLWPELSINHVDLNDNVSHVTFIEDMAHAVDTGANPFDFWMPECVMGFPVFRTYQPLGHAMVVAAYFITGKSIPLIVLFSWARFLSMVLLPLAFFVFARLIELPWLECAAVALISPLIAAADRGLFGLEYRSYTWYGYGMFPQSLSTLWMLPAIGLAYRAIRRGTHLTLAGLMLALTVLTHMIFGYLAAITVCLIALLPAESAAFRIRIRRLIWVGCAAIVLAAFQLLSIFQDGYLANRSQLEPAEKWNSFGAARVLEFLFSGGLLDHERIPVLSLLALLGVVLAVLRLRRQRAAGPELALLAGFVLWLLLYFGRPTWGSLLVLVGITGDMHLHRLIAGVQITLTTLAGIGLATIWRRIAGWLTPLAAAIVTAVLLWPLGQERWAFLEKNAVTGRENLAAYEAQRSNLYSALDAARHRSGRVFAGLGTGWGGQFKIGYVPVHNFLMTARIPAVSYIYHSMSLPSDPMMHFDDMRPAHYRLFNVRSVIVPAASANPPAFLTPLSQFGNFKVLDAPGAGYFDVVDVAAAMPMTRETFAAPNLRWLQSDWVESKRHLLLDFGGPSPAGLARLSTEDVLSPSPSPAGSPGEIISDGQQDQLYVADVTAARSSFVLFRMTWHPNWRVTVDGAARNTVMLSPGFLGVAVDPGKHHIECRYVPGSVRNYVALAGLILAGAMFAFERRVGRL
ncbi:MAG TPA: hypothetical protein VKE70_23835 [Candidatus Solibacter sp.]|nr:hypothetical protein [Candidatus Solibacter sp.]